MRVVWQQIFFFAFFLPFSARCARYIQHTFPHSLVKRRMIRFRFHGYANSKEDVSAGNSFGNITSILVLFFLLLLRIETTVPRTGRSLIHRVIPRDRLLTAWFIQRILELQVDLHLVEFVRPLIRFSNHVFVKSVAFSRFFDFLNVFYRITSFDIF